MSFSRAAARSLRSLRQRPLTIRPQLRFHGRRGYSSGNHGSAAGGGDAVWAAGAVAVTAPSVYFLWPSGGDDHHGEHGAHGKEHNEEHEEHEEQAEEETKSEPEEEKSEEPEVEEKSAEEGKPAEEETGDSEKSDDSSKAGGKDDETPNSSDGEVVEEKSDEKNTRKSTPDAKGGNKARLESKAAIKQGETDTEGGDGEPADKAAASKSAGGKNTQSGKQEGLSNTDTKHSLDKTNDPNTSKKGEGAPETAKVKGTVDPNRPQTLVRRDTYRQVLVNDRVATELHPTGNSIDTMLPQRSPFIVAAGITSLPFALYRIVSLNEDSHHSMAATPVQDLSSKPKGHPHSTEDAHIFHRPSLDTATRPSFLSRVVTMVSERNKAMPIGSAPPSTGNSNAAVSRRGSHISMPAGWGPHRDGSMIASNHEDEADGEWMAKLFCAPPGNFVGASSCLMSFFCGCFQYGRIHWRLDKVDAGEDPTKQEMTMKEYWNTQCVIFVAVHLLTGTAASIFLNALQRARVRIVYGIKGSFKNDFLVSCCQCAVMRQNEREILARAGDVRYQTNHKAHDHIANPDGTTTHQPRPPPPMAYVSSRAAPVEMPARIGSAGELRSKKVRKTSGALPHLPEVEKSKRLFSGDNLGLDKFRKQSDVSPRAPEEENGERTSSGGKPKQLLKKLAKIADKKATPENADNRERMATEHVEMMQLADHPGGSTTVGSVIKDQDADGAKHVIFKREARTSSAIRSRSASRTKNDKGKSVAPLTDVTQELSYVTEFSDCGGVKSALDYFEKEEKRISQHQIDECAVDDAETGPSRNPYKEHLANNLGESKSRPDSSKNANKENISEESEKKTSDKSKAAVSKETRRERIARYQAKQHHYEDCAEIGDQTPSKSNGTNKSKFMQHDLDDCEGDGLNSKSSTTSKRKSAAEFPLDQGHPRDVERENSKIEPSKDTKKKGRGLFKLKKDNSHRSSTSTSWSKGSEFSRSVNGTKVNGKGIGKHKEPLHHVETSSEEEPIRQHRLGSYENGSGTEADELRQHRLTSCIAPDAAVDTKDSKRAKGHRASSCPPLESEQEDAKLRQHRVDSCSGLDTGSDGAFLSSSGVPLDFTNDVEYPQVQTDRQVSCPARTSEDDASYEDAQENPSLTRYRLASCPVGLGENNGLYKIANGTAQHVREEALIVKSDDILASMKQPNGLSQISSAKGSDLQDKGTEVAVEQLIPPPLQLYLKDKVKAPASDRAALNPTAKTYRPCELAKLAGMTKKIGEGNSSVGNGVGKEMRGRGSQNLRF